jgi:hypothetical protein
MSSPDKSARSAAVPSAPAEASANVKFAGELRRFLELGAAQLDAAIRESDARVDKLATAVTAVATDARELEVQVQALDSGGPGEQQVRERIRQLAAQLDAHVQATVTSLQFYDKLIQRLTHVRDGLAIPSDSTVSSLDPARSDWNSMLEQVRSRYSMVEERVLFDFMMRGLSADQMLKALTGLRAVAAPGELEVF